MASLLSAMFTPTAYRRDRTKEEEEKDQKKRATKISDLIGNRAIAGNQGTMQVSGPDALLSDISGTIQPQEATGLYKTAPELATKLDQIKGWAASDDPYIMEHGMKELAEVRQPDARPSTPTLMALYDASKAEGYEGNLQSFVKDYNLWSAGTDSSQIDPAYAEKFELVSGDPMTNQTPAQINELVKTGAARMRPSAAEQTIQQGGEQVTGVIDSVFNTFMGPDGQSGLISGYSPTPPGMSPSETLWHRFKTVGEEGWDTWVNMHPGKVTWNAERSLISRQLGRKLFSEKGAGSDKDALASEQFFPVLPGSEIGFGDSKEVMVAKLEGLAEIYSFLAPSMAGGRKANYERYQELIEYHKGKVKDVQNIERQFYLDNGEIERIQLKIDKGEVTPTKAEMRIWALDAEEVGRLN